MSFEVCISIKTDGLSIKNAEPFLFCDVINFMKLRQFRNRMKQYTIWGLQGRYHLLTVASYLVTFLYLTEFLQFYPSTLALIMTMTGLLIILTQQVIDAAKFGSHKPNTFMGWIKSIPTKKSITLSGIGAESIDLSDKAHVTVSIPADDTIEKKLEFLLRQIAELDSAIARLDDRVDKVNHLLNKTKKEFQESINSLSMTLNNVISNHVVGSYDKSLFGINITICGTVIQFFNS